MSKTTKDFFDYDGLGPVGGGPTTPYVRCYESHPVLDFGQGKLYGGSCSCPVIKDADVFVGLDSYMTRRVHDYPWAKKKANAPIEVLFEITDGSIPKAPKQFVAMIDWLAEQLNAGKKVHVGCIGGHGRTGMVIAALAKVMKGETDAISWTRKNYCTKAVETDVQIEFLHHYFDIKKVKESKPKFKGISNYQNGTYSGTHQYYQDNMGKLPPTSTKFHTKGPREKDDPLMKARYLRSGNRQSIWTSLTNAKV